jgi:hypothetical protein
MAVQRGGTGQHEPPCTGLARRLQQVRGGLHVDLLEHRVRHQADMRCMQGGGMDDRVDARTAPAWRSVTSAMMRVVANGLRIQPHHFVGGRQRAEDRAPDPPGTAGQQNLH